MKKNLINALKKLVTSFGGEAKSNNAVDLVDEFADVAAQGGGGSEPLVIEVQQNNGEYECSTDPDVITDIVNNGKFCMMKLTTGYIRYFPVKEISYDAAHNYRALVFYDSFYESASSVYAIESYSVSVSGGTVYVYHDTIYLTSGV